MTSPSPTLDGYLLRLEMLRRLAWQEAQKAQRSANRLTQLTAHLDLLLSEIRSAPPAEEGER